MTDSAVSECGYCEGHGYTVQAGKVINCDRCAGSGKVVPSAVKRRLAGACDG